MTYLLDTNACIAVLNDRSSEVASKLATIPRQEVTLCQIVKAELLYGAYRSAKAESNLALLGSFFEQFSVLILGLSILALINLTYIPFRLEPDRIVLEMLLLLVIIACYKRAQLSHRQYTNGICVAWFMQASRGPFYPESQIVNATAPEGKDGS